MQFTNQQNDIFAALVETKENVAVVARAGCGKTSTIMAAVDIIARELPGKTMTLCAFNKAIATEMSEKLVAMGFTNNQLVSASTLHSLGFGLIRPIYKPKVAFNKVGDLVKKLNNPLAQEYYVQLCKLVGLAKQAGFGFFENCQINNLSAWYELIDHYDVNGFDDTTQADEVIALAQQVYRKSLEDTKTIDFDDMILFPLVKNMVVKYQKDFIFIDEAQDLSRSRQALALKFVKPNGRVVVVGDDKQAIYGFAGADSSSLPNLISNLSAVVLPLSVTWRCPKAVVALAQTIVPDIEAADAAADGEVISLEKLPTDLDAKTAILCRNTAPLISTAYSLLRQGIGCKVEGRDIGVGIKNLINKWKVTTIEALLNRVETFEEREIQKAQAKGKKYMIDGIKDKCETIRAICEAVNAKNQHKVSDVIAFIDSIFADGVENVTVLATYHRSKGREWDRVILVEHDTRCPSKFAQQEWQLQQERNLAYVAFTRAKKTLAFLN